MIFFFKNIDCFVYHTNTSETNVTFISLVNINSTNVHYIVTPSILD